MTENVVTTYGYLDFEEGELEFDIEITFDAWGEEKPETGPDALYPGCDAGVSVSDITVTTQPDIETVRNAIRWLSGDDKISGFEHNGIEYILDYNKGVVFDDCDRDAVNQLIIDLS